jgi:aminopeptidase N
MANPSIFPDGPDSKVREPRHNGTRPNNFLSDRPGAAEGVWGVGAYRNATIALIILSILVTASCTALFMEEARDEHAEVQEGWVIPDGPMQVLRERTWNLHHQKLRVRFQFEREQVIGDTEMFFTSKGTQSEVIIDAKTMVFDSLYDARTGRNFSYVQDSAMVTVQLGLEFQEGDTLVLGISFVSTPPQRGLYFVNPRGEDPVKPTQIWTLGQPEDNSFWFPTIDHPAERATQETWISVPDRFQTLSNGLLLDSRVLPGDSLRTDYWRLHQPHAPYLFVLAVGEYEIVEEKRGDILYRYYVETDFLQTVDLIYKNTVDMVRFSEEVTGVPYPWDPVYAQAPVHDFIARGMENTTATLLYDAVQFDLRAAQDLSNQDLIMHEVIHQWFGNLVTCKDWANLPLNEGFANYFESAYRLHNDGRDEYLWKNHNDRLRYFTEAERYRRPIIFYRYGIPEDMYDRHTYQKAGQVLRMLHDYLGDEPWWKGVRLWLERHAFDAVDIFDFQSTFEDASGLELYPFIEQWFLKPGHPYLDVSHEIYGNRAELTIRQVHDTTRQPLFTLYPEVLVITESGEMRERVRVDGPEHRYSFESNYEIRDVIVDPDRVQLAQYFRDISISSLTQRLQSDHLLVRAEALSMAEDFMEYATVRSFIADMALNDAFWGIRLTAYGLLSDYAWLYDLDEALSYAFHAVHDNEEAFEVRVEALNILRNLEIPDSIMHEKVFNHLTEMMADTSYFVSAAAIVASGELFPKRSATMAGPYMDIESYQDVIKTSVIRSLATSEESTAVAAIMALADDPGERRYRQLALNHLRQSIRLLDDSDRILANELTGRIIHDPIREYRLIAYSMIVELGSTDFLDALHKILEENDPDLEERRAIKDAIRVLQYNRALEAD